MVILRPAVENNHFAYMTSCGNIDCRRYYTPVLGYQLRYNNRAIDGLPIKFINGCDAYGKKEKI